MDKHELAPLTVQHLDALVADYFSRNRGPGYSVAVTDATLDLSQINIRVTFLAGRSYCCADPGCHFSIAGLRKVASESNVELPDGLCIGFNGVVEDGAVLRSSGGITRRYEYDEIFIEGG